MPASAGECALDRALLEQLLSASAAITQREITKRQMARNLSCGGRWASPERSGPQVPCALISTDKDVLSFPRLRIFVHTDFVQRSRVNPSEPRPWKRLADAMPPSGTSILEMETSGSFPPLTPSATRL